MAIVVVFLALASTGSGSSVFVTCPRVSGIELRFDRFLNIRCAKQLQINGVGIRDFGMDVKVAGADMGFQLVKNAYMKQEPLGFRVLVARPVGFCNADKCRKISSVSPKSV